MRNPHTEVTEAQVEAPRPKPKIRSLKEPSATAEPIYPTCPAEDSDTELEKDLRSLEAMSIMSRPDNEYVTRDSLV